MIWGQRQQPPGREKRNSLKSIRLNKPELEESKKMVGFDNN
jgi:hypothetical protein